jgi:hypothetical protein
MAHKCQSQTDWKAAGAQYLKDKGYTSELHSPTEAIDIGTLGTILKNMNDIKGGG